MNETTASTGTQNRGTARQPWHQRPGESLVAYRSFVCYRDLGEGRTLVAVARALGKNPSLIYRRAHRLQWRERVYAWDLARAAEDEATSEAAVRQHREGVLRERLEDLDRMGRASLAFFRTLIRRDPETGEVDFDARFTPQAALRLLELALRAQGAFDRPTAEEKSEKPLGIDPFGLADGEVAELIDLARARADQHERRKGNGNGSHQDNTQQEQHEGQEDEPEEAERD